MESIPVTRLVSELHEFAKFPLTIHQRISLLLTWLIPYGFASYYPASYLLGRDVSLLAWPQPAGSRHPAHHRLSGLAFGV
ncbi:MAG: ABC-2 family transporter protein [Anaerolineae bacterium]|uniref:ABC-2 family transporter protein n=1 Tax=Candidatus Amarolinea dominans TaxID=3140696 RepID=UPI003136B625|nr:ABC-2 family transporter protein [Anaerolineae bacterium]